MRFRFGIPFLAAVVVAAVPACGGSGGGNTPTSAPPVTSASSQPTQGTSSPAERPSAVTSATPQSWAENAEAACKAQLASVGGPDHVGSPESDAQMAADSGWAARLQSSTVQALSSLGQPPSDGATLVSDLGKAAEINTELLQLFDQGQVVTTRILDDQNEVNEIAHEVGQLQISAVTPSCTEIAAKVAPV